MKTLSGQSIVETVIATAIISIAVVAALSLMNYTQKQANYAKTLNLAVDFNTQASDWLRQEKTTLGWATIAGKIATDAGAGGSVTYCLNVLPTDASGGFTALTSGACGTGAYISGTLFVREVSFTSNTISSGSTEATVSVSWTDSNATRQNTTTLELSQWN